MPYQSQHNNWRMTVREPDHVPEEQDKYPSKVSWEVLPALCAPYPVWYLDIDGFIIAANGLAAWLWETDDLAGRSVFEIFRQSLLSSRIPVERNEDYLIKKCAVARRVAGRHNGQQAKLFVRAVEEKTHDNQTLHSDIRILHLRPKKEFEYDLHIVEPRPTQERELLKFEVTVSEVQGGMFLACYQPGEDNVFTKRLASDEFQKLVAACEGDMGKYALYCYSGEREHFFNKLTLEAVRAINKEQSGREQVSNVAEPQPKPEEQREPVYDPNEDRWFADERARAAFKTTKDVYRVRAQAGLLFDPLERPTERIAFDPEDAINEARAWSAIATAGVVVGTDDENSVFVPRQTVQILDKLEIRYRRVLLNEGEDGPGS